MARGCSLLLLMEEPSIVSLSFGRPMLLKQNATWHHHLKLYYHFSIGISSKTPKGLSSFCGRSSYIWNTPIESIIKEPSNVVDSNGKVRHGFVLSRDHVEKLKKWVSFKCKRSNQKRPIMLALILIMMKPGNCLAPRIVSLKRGMLIGENAIIEAVIAIRRKVRDFQLDAMKGFESVISDSEELSQPGTKSVVTIAGSPKIGAYETDFGWGKPKKSEILHIENSGSISLSDSRDQEGGVEVWTSTWKGSYEQILYYISWENISEILRKFD
ncbi:hypothetical protein JHK82_052428 [Glycine max]|nr:hypothetical protein JHK86_052268 [Glycine max]KAG4926636.1 hypothetical protein JHK85_053122 [Glycine max]KAG5082269.1 hypothetical protein JHK84_052307 [Glycine max]KAG5085031.1 hypothetical protein JHK82_052428 [Glycine max]KAH1192882.1 Coumaroyl-CoA:anthocyanidin 3-O-glucoside-6''-O-coumaroyltransferase 1 [Glycine max]